MVSWKGYWINHANFEGLIALFQFVLMFAFISQKKTKVKRETQRQRAVGSWGSYILTNRKLRYMLSRNLPIQTQFHKKENEHFWIVSILFCVLV
mgnify:CR=1 FL=1